MSQTPYLKKKHEGVVVGSYASYADVVGISCLSQGSNVAKNYVTVDGKYHLETIFKEPKEAWGTLLYNPISQNIGQD